MAGWLVGGTLAPLLASERRFERALFCFKMAVRSLRVGVPEDRIRAVCVAFVSALQ